MFQPIFDLIFLHGVDRISDSSTSILTSNYQALAPLWLVPFALLLKRVFHLFSRRKPQWLPSRWDPRSPQPQLLLSVLHLGFGCARFCCLELPHIFHWDESCHNIDSIDHVQTTNIVISSLLDDAGVERTTLPEPSAVGTIIAGDACLAFTTGLPEISLVDVSLGRALLRSLRSCGPNSIGESSCSF